MATKKIDYTLPWAVVLHIAFTGYGVVKSLASHGIPIFAFQKDLSVPEAKSNLCEGIASFRSDDELLTKLIRFAKKQPQKPVLFITSDIYVRFFVKYRELIEELYRIHYPSNDVVSLLLNKDAFVNYAQTQNITIPKTRNILSDEDVDKAVDQIRFPAILKPYDKTLQWRTANLPKAIIVNTKDQFLSVYKKVSAVEKRIVLQEWVPGPDSNVHYCLTYFDEKSRCLASFTGMKIRQWPVGTGSTASTIPTNNNTIKKLTIEILGNLSYRGFGSIEYKKHEIDGDYYIMEPTVGRPNQQSFIATANGCNMPLLAYSNLTGIPMAYFRKMSNPVMLIDEWSDLASALVHMKRQRRYLKTYVSTLRFPKVFRFYDRADPVVFFHSFLHISKTVLRKFVSKLKSYQKPKTFPY